MAKPKAVEFLAPDRCMLDIKRRATMSGGFAETEIPRVAEAVVDELDGEFESLLEQKRRRMTEIVGGAGDVATAAARAEELRRLAKDVHGLAPVFGYHGLAEMAAVLADTVDRLGFEDEQVRSFCRWQVEALGIVVRRRLRGAKPQDVADTINDARQALDKLARRQNGRS